MILYSYNRGILPWLAAILSLSIINVATAQDQKSRSIDDFLPSLSAKKELSISSPKFTAQSVLNWSWACDQNAPCRTDASVVFLRLRVRLETQPADRSWQLAVLNAAGERIDTLTADSFKDQNTIWTERILGRVARVELRGVVGLQITIDQIRYSHTDPEPKAIIGKNDLQDLVLAYPPNHRYHTFSRAVPVIFFQTLLSEKDTDCTGVMLAPSLLLTNYHCISQPKQLRTAYVQFGYETNNATPECFRILEIVVADEALDFSLLRLDRPASTWTTAQVDIAPIKKDRKLVIIQYPNGSPKKVSAIGCEVESPEVSGVTADFFHLCDADGGTSGAPVMDRSTGKVLGLHHIEQWNYQKKRDQNRAIRIEPILDKIRQCKPSVFDEITLASR